MKDELLEMWRIHCRVGHYALAAMAPEALAAKGLKGRTVGAQLAHLHNVRRMWLTSAEPALAEGVEALDAAAPLDKDALGAALRASDVAIEQLVDHAVDRGRLKGFKPHPVAFVGYLIAHESFHRGDIGVRLTEAGFPLDRKTDFGMWEWGVR
jgi:uncharacterized damage-inducible protein DinB